MTRNSSSTSGGVRTAVGSSRMRISRVEGERLEDLHPLALADRKPADRRAGVEVEAVARRAVRARAFEHAAPVGEQPEAAWLAAEKDVLGHASSTAPGRSAGGPCRCRARLRRAGRRCASARPSQHDLPGGRLVDADQDVHQRALARAVLAAARRAPRRARTSRSMPASACLSPNVLAMPTSRSRGPGALTVGGRSRLLGREGAVDLQGPAHHLRLRFVDPRLHGGRHERRRCRRARRRRSSGRRSPVCRTAPCPARICLMES